MKGIQNAFGWRVEIGVNLAILQAQVVNAKQQLHVDIVSKPNQDRIARSAIGGLDWVGAALIRLYFDKFLKSLKTTEKKKYFKWLE